MSIAAEDQIEYPESDGKPMGETDLHRDWMIAILDRLRHRYRGQQVYVASDLLVYYEAGQPTKFIVPDDFVVLDCPPHRRRIFKTWEEQRVPDVVFEVTSRGTSSEDIVTKPVIYERMGVKEYFLYDPTAEYLKPALQGYRLVDGTMTVIEPLDGKLQCQTLGIELYLEGSLLVMRDSGTQLPLLTEAESERNEKEVERTQREAEQAARLAAEARVRDLEAELRRLRDEEGDSAN